MIQSCKSQLQSPHLLSWDSLIFWCSRCVVSTQALHTNSTLCGVSEKMNTILFVPSRVLKGRGFARTDSSWLPYLEDKECDQPPASFLNNSTVPSYCAVFGEKDASYCEVLGWELKPLNLLPFQHAFPAFPRKDWHCQICINMGLVQIQHWFVYTFIYQTCWILN
jgi:hypothetical protein